MAAVDEQQVDHESGRGIRDQIERYRSAFIAVLALVVIAAVVGGYILAHENLKLPGWVPVLGHEYFKLEGDFQTAGLHLGHARSQQAGHFAGVRCHD